MIPQDFGGFGKCKPHRQNQKESQTNGRAAVVLQHNESVVTAADEMMEGNLQE